WVGPHSDVYGLGRLSAFALTGRPDPDAGDRVILPEPWQKLLDAATAWAMAHRLPHVGAVLDRLAPLSGPHGPIDRSQPTPSPAAAAPSPAPPWPPSPPPCPRPPPP